MHISDLSYLERVFDTTAIDGGIAVAAYVRAIGTGGSTGVSTHVKVTNGTSYVDGSWANSIVSVDVSGTGGDITGNIDISGLTDADQVTFTEGESEFNIIVNPLNFEYFVLDTLTPREVEPLLTS